MVRKFALMIALLLASGLSAGAQTQSAPPPTVGSVSAKPTDVRRDSFDIVWRTVKEKHFDPHFGGVDWDKVREKYEPRLSKIKTDAELYAMLQEMIGELHQSHFAIIPPEWIATEQSGDTIGGIGIDLRLIDNQAVIARVEADSAAARAGLRSGFVITKVDGTNVAPVINQLTKSMVRPAMARLYAVRRLLALVEGKPATSVRIHYLDDKDQPRDISLERQKRSGEMSPAFGNFPAQYTEFEAKRLDGNIGYIRFNIFVMPLMDRIRAAIRQMHDAPGLIIDLRGNPAASARWHQASPAGWRPSKCRSA